MRCRAAVIPDNPMISRFFHCLFLILAAAPAAQSAIMLVSAPSIASDDSITGHTTFANVTVQAGDYVVVSTASNKSFAQNQLTFSWTGTEGVSGASTSLSSQETYASYLSYTSVIAGGSYDFSILAANSNLTANSALYVLRPGSGEMITVAGTASQAQAAGAASALSYLFGSSLTSGIAIEAATTQSGGAFTLDADYLTPNATAAGNGRLISYSTLVSGGSWGSSHAFTNTPDDIASIGAVFTTSSVPEPSRALLLACGMWASLMRRRRP
jgi:hypothetical protein